MGATGLASRARHAQPHRAQDSCSSPAWQQRWQHPGVPTGERGRGEALLAAALAARRNGPPGAHTRGPCTLVGTPAPLPTIFRGPLASRSHVAVTDQLLHVNRLSAGDAGPAPRQRLPPPPCAGPAGSSRRPLPPPQADHQGACLSPHRQGFSYLLTCVRNRPPGGTPLDLSRLAGCQRRCCRHPWPPTALPPATNIPCCSCLRAPVWCWETQSSRR